MKKKHSLYAKREGIKIEMNMLHLAIRAGSPEGVQRLVDIGAINVSDLFTFSLENDRSDYFIFDLVYL